MHSLNPINTNDRGMIRQGATPERKRPVVCWVVSSPSTIKAFLKNHLAKLSIVHDITIIANGEPKEAALDCQDQIAWIATGVERKIHPIRDALALLRLCLEFRARRFGVVHSVTPKAGLLAMTAAWFTRVPIRIHWFTGQVWSTRAGLTRAFLKNTDRWIAHVSTHLLVDSPSQLRFLVQQRIAPEGKMTVLAEGSICGVDEERFRPDPEIRPTVRARLGIPSAALVFLFVGRCTFDKGLMDLAEAFDQLCSERDDAYLVICGPDEDNVVPRMVQKSVRAGKRLVYMGTTNRPEQVMAAADVLCLPSYREGFGQVVVEAAAAGLPCIASRIYGLVDAVENGITGLLHDPHCPAEILEKMRTLSQDPQLRSTMASAARLRAATRFNQRVVTQALADYYERILGTATSEN